MNQYLKRKLREPITFKPQSKRHTQKSPRLKRQITFGRSGSLIAINDEYIRFFLRDTNYRVTDDGVIWTRISRQGHITNDWRPKPTTCRDGYQVFTYCKKSLSAHRVIYQALIGNLESDLVINHIDNDRSNNDPSNLELVTQRINSAPPRYNLK